MPKGHRGPRTDEEYIAWITRMQLEPEDLIDRETARRSLARQLGIEEDSDSFEQIAAGLEYGIALTQTEMIDSGIKGFQYGTKCGKQTRFGIKGMRGSFGYDRMRQVLGERSGRWLQERQK